MTKRAVLIAGPTASGKSHAAIQVAERLGGVIVNADSMQVYRELRILSARPSSDDEARVPHRLYGTVGAGEAYSAGRWLAQVSDVLNDLWRVGRLPIVVGGTGLYFHVLLNGLANIPNVPPEVHAAWKARLDEEGCDALHRLLAERDPELASRLEPTDAQRIVRGLGVEEATGRKLSAWQSEPGEGAPLVAGDAVRIVLWPDRAELYERCDRRLEAMVAAGAVDEVRALMALSLAPDLPVMKALGVRQLMAHLDGEVDLADAICDAQTSTRRYAKRQMTWFRRNMIAWNEVSEKDSESMRARIFAILRENELTGPT